MEDLFPHLYHNLAQLVLTKKCHLTVCRWSQVRPRGLGDHGASTQSSSPESSRLTCQYHCNSSILCTKPLSFKLLPDCVSVLPMRATYIEHFPAPQASIGKSSPLPGLHSSSNSLLVLSTFIAKNLQDETFFSRSSLLHYGQLGLGIDF